MGIKKGISSKGEIMHYSVAALIKDGNKYLLIDRARLPYGFACVAGHIDENETFQKALEREVLEEIGVEVTTSRLVFQGELEKNTCGKGANVHHWFVFKVNYKGELKIDTKEVKSIGWYTKKEIKNLNKPNAFDFLLKQLRFYDSI